MPSDRVLSVGSGQGDESGDKRASLFGIRPTRVRGVIVLLVFLGLVYFTIFESDPPPEFTEVEIVIPPKPESDFDEKTIVLPEFAPSPVDEDAQPAEGVVIATVSAAETAPDPQREQPEQGKAAPKPDAVTKPAEEREVANTAKRETDAQADGFFVQVVALSDGEVASQLASDLKELLNEPSYVQQVERGGKQLFRVRLGPFGADKGKANEVLNRLRQNDEKLGANAFVDEE